MHIRYIHVYKSCKFSIIFFLFNSIYYTWWDILYKKVVRPNTRDLPAVIQIAYFEFDLRILMRDDSDRFLEQFVIVSYCFRLYADARLHRKSVKATRSPKRYLKDQNAMRLADRSRPLQIGADARSYECLWHLQDNVKRSHGEIVPVR